MIELTDANSLDTLLSNNNVSILKFHATWCGPCKGYSAIFSEVSEQYEESVPFISIDIDSFPELAVRYEVRTVPMTVKVVKGVPEKNKAGIMSVADLNQFLH